jgi:hypothetical protein
MNKRTFVGALLALLLTVAVVGPVAAATHITFCFDFQGKHYCINIPLAYKITFKIPPDKPNEATDIAVVVDAFAAAYKADPSPDPWLQALVEDKNSQWYLVDASGKHVAVIDMATHSASGLEAETQFEY